MKKEKFLGCSCSVDNVKKSRSLFNEVYVKKANNPTVVDKTIFNEQMKKIQESDFILPNRFTVNLFNDNLELEPFEISGFYEYRNKIDLLLRGTSENMGKINEITKSLRKHLPHWLLSKDNKYKIFLNVLDSGLSVVQTVCYDNCVVRDVTFPYYDYKDNYEKILTYGVTLSFDKKHVQTK